MTCKIVTITGADNSVAQQDLIDFSEEFPFVEWGLLISEGRKGSARYPTYEWLGKFYDLAGTKDINISFHLCGRTARKALKSANLFLLPFVDRVQLNGWSEEDERAAYILSNNSPASIILQTRSLNAFHVAKRVHSVSILWDVSGGKGILPKEWPYFDRAGYAGGISPSNVKEVLNLIEQNELAKTNSYWIDMESGVRDKNDQLDLTKVRQVLEKVVETCMK